MIFAVLPVKDPARAKQRLAGVLSPGDRAALAHSMYRRVLDALRAARGLDRILVVTSDASIVPTGVLVLEETDQVSHSHSADRAARHAASLGATTVVSLPIDLPLVTAAEIESLVALPLPDLRIVPDAAGTGTNCLVRTPPLCIEARFGPGSFGLHLNQARERGLRVEVLRPPGIVFDVDTPEDYQRLLCQSR